jgi:2-keto-4-pentenoate hydratase
VTPPIQLRLTASPAEVAAELVEARLELDDAERVFQMIADSFTHDGIPRGSRRMAVEVLVADHRVNLWRQTVAQLETTARVIGLRP